MCNEPGATAENRIDLLRQSDMMDSRQTHGHPPTRNNGTAKPTKTMFSVALINIVIISLVLILYQRCGLPS